MHTASLVWITPNAEGLMGKIARVSSPLNQDNPNIAGLLKYMIKHKHWSPFEMASMCVEIVTTRDISAQIIRHRSFSFQEFSQRYAVVTSPPVIPDLRRQDLVNRQSSIDVIPENITDNLKNEIELLFLHTDELYCKLIDAGVAKECARGILPLASATRIYMSGTIRSWIHYCELRAFDKNGAQKEHQLVANAILKIIEEQLPIVYNAAFVTS